MKKFFVILFILSFSLLFIINLSFSKKENIESPKISIEIYSHIGKFKNNKISEKDIEIPVVIKFKDTSKAKSLKKEFKKIKQRQIDKKYLSAEISLDEFNSLKENPYIEAIYYNPKLKIFLSNSTKLLGADSFWNITLNGEKINGSAESACVIDTGIDFSHEAFGNCTLSYFNETGNNQTYFLESQHPYPLNTKIKYKINYTGFSKIAVHFSNISVEKEWDFIKILDQNNFTIAAYTGNYNNLWSPSINGDTLYILLESDESINGYGFFIDEIKNGTTNNTLNWSCEKIISGWDFVNDKEIPYDDNGHGTHVSGIIASQNESYPGVAKGSKIVSLKAMNSDGDGSSVDVASAINFCIENKERFNISVISMSLGDGTFSYYCDNEYEWFSEIVQNAIDKNISVVVSSGNNGNSNGIAFPACLRNVTSVGSVDKSMVVSSYSQSSSILDLLAYGTNIKSAKLNGGFISGSGTSMAAPHVSGSILLINHYKKKESQLSYRPDQIETILKSTGILINDSRNNLVFPLINLSNALKEIYLLPQLSFSKQDLNNSNLSVNYSYIEFSFSTYVKNITLVYDSINVQINGSYTNLSYNITNMSEGFHNYSIYAYDIMENYIGSGLYYLYVDTIKPKSIDSLNASLLEDGSVFLVWPKVIFDINNNQERSILYNIYRKQGNETTLIAQLEEDNGIINYTDSNITNNNYTYFILTSDASFNINESITEKSSVNISALCSTEFSEWSAFSSCSGGIQTRQRNRICFAKQETETESQSCVVKKSGGSSRSSFSSSGIPNYQVKTYYVKNSIINLTETIKQIRFDKEKLQLKYEEILPEKLKNLITLKNKTYAYINISVNESSPAEIIFSVKKSWLYEKNISPEDIALFKYNESWIELSTELISNLTNEYLYTSFTNGFSIFAISEKYKEDKEELFQNKTQNKTNETNSSILEDNYIEKKYTEEKNHAEKSKKNPLLQIHEPEKNNNEKELKTTEKIKNYNIFLLIFIFIFLTMPLFYISISYYKKINKTKK